MATRVIEPERRSERIGPAVVTAVADATNRDPTTIGPLYDVIDTDALDALFQPTTDGVRRRRGRVTFSLAGCEVTVYADDRIEVQNHDDL